MKSSALTWLTIITAFCLGSFSHSSNAQDSKDERKKIEVMGSAEMEVLPDVIHLTISLREYLKDGKNRVSIGTLEKHLQDVVLKAGVPKENFQIENVYGYNWNWEKKKNEEFFARKSYRIKLKDLNMVNAILGNLDQKGIESVNIGEVTHSKIEEYKMELKAKALLAAKEKADYLLKSIGEEAGEVLQIQEVYDGYVQPYETRMMSMKMESMDMADSQIDFRNIKLKYEMRASFAIK